MQILVLDISEGFETEFELLETYSRQGNQVGRQPLAQPTVKNLISICRQKYKSTTKELTLNL